MKIGFNKSIHLEEYHGFYEGEPVDFIDGEKKDIDIEKARKLLEDFPDNFYSLKELAKPKELAEPPEDKMIRKEEIKPGRKRKTPRFKKIE